MNSPGMTTTPHEPPNLLAWRAMLADKTALLDRPGAYHKTLIVHAHALHRAKIIDNHGLGDLLELADSALAYAIEALIDLDSDQ